MRFHICPRSYGDDRIAADGHTPVTIDRARGIHGHDDSATDDQVNFLSLLRKGRVRGQERERE
jgi:hypothetical protein